MRTKKNNKNDATTTTTTTYCLRVHSVVQYYYVLYGSLTQKRVLGPMHKLRRGIGFSLFPRHHSPTGVRA